MESQPGREPRDWETLRRWDPERIGPYVVLGRLGSGSMGQVYLGRSAAGRLVAVKTIRVELAEEAGFRTRFAQEVAAARKVSGVFTAAVVEADPEADLPWLATAYVPAPSLSRLVLACGPLPVATVRWLAAGCAEALASIHGAGLVHRDLKPSNVLVAPDGPRVIDFGVARAAERMGRTTARGAVGTKNGAPLSPPKRETKCYLELPESNAKRGNLSSVDDSESAFPRAARDPETAENIGGPHEAIARKCGACR